MRNNETGFAPALKPLLHLLAVGAVIWSGAWFVHERSLPTKYDGGTVLIEQARADEAKPEAKPEEKPAAPALRYVIVVSIENKEGKKGKLRYGARDFDNEKACKDYLELQKTEADPAFVQALTQLKLLLDQNNAWPTAIDCVPNQPEGVTAAN